MSKLPKAITIELMSVDNKRVLQKAKFAMPHGHRMTGAGVDLILDKYVADLEERQPNHRYRLVPMVGYKFRLVWEPQTLSEMATEAALA